MYNDTIFEKTSTTTLCTLEHEKDEDGPLFFSFIVMFEDLSTTKATVFSKKQFKPEILSCEVLDVHIENMSKEEIGLTLMWLLSDAISDTRVVRLFCILFDYMII